MPRLPFPVTPPPTPSDRHKDILVELANARHRLSEDDQHRPRAGAVWIFEGIDELGEIKSRPAYFTPNAPYGLFVQQVVNLPPQHQANIMEMWIRANFEPSSSLITSNLGADPHWHIENRIDLEFGDHRVGPGRPAVRMAAEALQTPIWFLKSQNHSTITKEALQKLLEFESALRSLPAHNPTNFNLHNNPPEPVEENPLSSHSVELILSKIEQTKMELLAAQPNMSIVTNTAILYLTT